MYCTQYKIRHKSNENYDVNVQTEPVDFDKLCHNGFYVCNKVDVLLPQLLMHDTKTT